MALVAEACDHPDAIFSEPTPSIRTRGLGTAADRDRSVVACKRARPDRRAAGRAFGEPGAMATCLPFALRPVPIRGWPADCNRASPEAESLCSYATVWGSHSRPVVPTAGAPPLWPLAVDPLPHSVPIPAGGPASLHSRRVPCARPAMRLALTLAPSAKRVVFFIISSCLSRPGKAAVSDTASPTGTR